jgi:hypothetical protein
MDFSIIASDRGGTIYDVALMGFLKKLFEEKRPVAKTGEQAVIVKIVSEALDGHAIRPLENEIESAISNAGVGEFDGHEFGPWVSFAGWPLKVQNGGVPFQATLYMYGPDADKLFAAVSPILMKSELCKGGRVLIRYGEPGAPQKEVQL